MIKRICIAGIILVLMFFTCATLAIFYRPHNVEIQTKLTVPNKVLSIVEIDEPNPKEISEGETATYSIKLNENCNYKEGTITVTGPAEITDITKNELYYTVTVSGSRGTGNIVLNVSNGAFYNDKNDTTMEIKKDGLIVNNTQKLKKLVETYLGDDIDKIGIYYFDLNTQTYFGINEEKEFFPASNSKLYTVITLYDLAFAKKIDLNKKIYYNPNDYEAGSHLDLSKPYKLSELAQYAIIYSDNIAFHMLNRYIGLNKITKNYKSIIGHDITKSDNSTPDMSAKDAFLILRKIYYNRNKNIYYNELINNMQNTKAKNTKIVRYLPDVVARKGGDYVDYHHDAAIVYDENPYILTFFSKGVANANKKISKVSKLINDNR